MPSWLRAVTCPSTTLTAWRRRTWHCNSWMPAANCFMPPPCAFYRDTRLEHHASEAVNAAHIRNTALLAYLRYPIPYWALGALQVLNRVRYAAQRGPLARNCERCLANSRGCLALSPAARPGSRCHDRLEQGTCPPTMNTWCPAVRKQVACESAPAACTPARKPLY